MDKMYEMKDVGGVLVRVPYDPPVVKTTEGSEEARMLSMFTGAPPLLESNSDDDDFIRSVLLNPAYR